MTSLKTLNDINIKNKDILLRVDFNVPIEDGKVGDLTRIKAVIPTIEYLRSQGARVALISHMGRPDGKVDARYSLRALIPVLHTLLPGVGLTFRENYINIPRAHFWSDTNRGDVILCENIRFHAGEEKNDMNFAASLASLADICVNDAFAACHRAHASISAITNCIPTVAGLLLASEISAIESHYLHAAKPLMAVIGGSKVSSKIDVLKALVPKVDILAIGGGMANSFLLAMGKEVGLSLVEKSALPLVEDILSQAKLHNTEILLPVDVVVAAELAPGVTSTIKTIDEIGPEDRILDIGPASVTLFNQAASRAKTLLWNGPLGAFEIEPFDKGTLDFAQHVVKLTQVGKLVSLTGGGDSVAALAKLDLESGFTYVSTGGGAFLEFIEGKILPGLAVLSQTSEKIQVK